MRTGWGRTASMKLKLLVYLMLLSSLPVASMGWLSAAYGGRAVAEMTYRMNESALQNMEKEINGEFRKLDNLMLQYSYQYSVFLPYVAKDLSYVNYSTVWELGDILTNLRSGLNDAEEVDFYSIPYGKILTSGGLLLDEDAFGDALVLSKARSAASGIWINTRESINERLPGKLLAYTRPVQNKRTSKIEGVVIVYLNAASLSRSLLAAGDGDNEYTVLDREGRIVLDSDETRIGRTMNDSALFAKLDPGEREEGLQFRDRVNGVPSLVNARYSEYRDWYYVSAAPLRKLMEPSERLTAILWAISLGLIAMAVLLATAASKSLYAPVQRLTQRIFGTRLGDGSNELSRIAAYIESVEEDNESLQREIGTYMEEAQAYALLQLLLGNVESGEDPQADGFGDGAVALYLLELDRLYMESRYSKNDRFLYYFAVRNIAEELLRGDGPVKILMVRPGLFAVIEATGDGPDVRALRERANGLLTAVRTYLKLPCLLSASYAAGGLQGLGDAYAEGMKALRYSFIYGHGQAILSAELDPSVSAEAEELETCERELAEALQAGDPEQAERLFGQLFETIRDQYSLSPEEMFGYFASLSGRLWDAAVKRGAEPEGGSFREWLVELARRRTLPEVEALMREGLLRSLRGGRHEEREGRLADEERSIAEVASYIRDHYDEDLSLQLCADRVGLNPYQLSRTFKKVMGVNFVDYVIDYRVGIAKELLADPEIKIAEISDKLRYGSDKSFIRLFKKVTGLTPGAYRKQLLREPE